MYIGTRVYPGVNTIFVWLSKLGIFRNHGSIWRHPQAVGAGM